MSDTPEVTLSLGWTRNLGNFESLRVDVGLSLPVKHGETVDATFEKVYVKLEQKLIEYVNRASKGLE